MAEAKGQRPATNKPRPGDIVLLLRPAAEHDDKGRDIDYRLKVLLKRLLRLYAFECAGIHWYPPAPATPAAPPSAHNQS